MRGPPLSDENDKTGKTPEWVSCQHSIDNLVEYLDGVLPPEMKASLDRHFKLCPPCRDVVRKYRAVPDLCQKAMKDEVPEDVADRLSSFLRAKCKGC